MNRKDKINEGQEQLDYRNHYQPLDEPIVRPKSTSMRVKHLIKALHQAGCTDDIG